MRSKDAKKFKSKRSPSSSNSAIFAVMHPFRFLNPQWDALSYGFWILQLSQGGTLGGPSRTFSLPRVMGKSCLGPFGQALDWGQPGLAKKDQELGAQGSAVGVGQISTGNGTSSFPQPLPDIQEATPGSTQQMYPCRYPGCISGSTQLMCSGTSGVH